MEEINYIKEAFSERDKGGDQLVDYLHALQILPKDIVTSSVNPINGHALLIYRDCPEYQSLRLEYQAAEAAKTTAAPKRFMRSSKRK